MDITYALGGTGEGVDVAGNAGRRRVLLALRQVGDAARPAAAVYVLAGRVLGAGAWCDRPGYVSVGAQDEDWLDFGFIVAYCIRFDWKFFM